MAGIAVSELAMRFKMAAVGLTKVALSLPGATVVRNEVGNLAITRADGTYAGYVDVLTGEVAVFDDDGRKRD